MTAGGGYLEDTAEDLFEDAPCGYLFTRPDGTIVGVNRTFEAWTGLKREALTAGRRFVDLLTVGGRIYHETHFVPLLHMQGTAREIAVDIVRADGSRLPALINAVLHRDAEGSPRVIRTTVFDATDRRRYEEELLRARRREQAIAQELQQSLLSGALPDDAALDLEVVYRPGVRGLDVGGDWYDAFWTGDPGTIGVVVGDVVGRGIGAAAAMGQLRSAVRALASTGLGPAALLQALDGYVRRHEVGRMATVVHAQLGLRTGELRFACAGHPPPLLAVPEEHPRLLWGGRSLPLGAHHGGGAREEAEHRLAPGAAVLMYTDGLVERRSSALDTGLERLAGTVGRQPPATPAAALASAAVAGLDDADGGPHRDDVCLVVARLAP